eukprot:Gb_06510 [translate_table: standard]
MSLPAFVLGLPCGDSWLRRLHGGEHGMKDDRVQLGFLWELLGIFAGNLAHKLVGGGLCGHQCANDQQVHVGFLCCEGHWQNLYSNSIKQTNKGECPFIGQGLYDIISEYSRTNQVTAGSNMTKNYCKVTEGSAQFKGSTNEVAAPILSSGGFLLWYHSAIDFLFHLTSGKMSCGHNISRFYSGRIAYYDPACEEHTIVYDDGDEEKLDMSKERWEFDFTIPSNQVVC